MESIFTPETERRIEADYRAAEARLAPFHGKIGAVLGGLDRTENVLPEVLSGVHADSGPDRRFVFDRRPRHPAYAPARGKGPRSSFASARYLLEFFDFLSR